MNPLPSDEELTRRVRESERREVMTYWAIVALMGLAFAGFKPAMYLFAVMLLLVPAGLVLIVCASALFQSLALMGVSVVDDATPKRE